MPNYNWHNLAIEEVEGILKTNIKVGLSKDGVEFRREKFGENKLVKEKPLNRTRIFFSQFKSPLVYILVIAGIVTLIFKEFTDVIVIFSAVGLNIIVGYVQENKASKALVKLKEVLKHKTIVLRDGQEKEILQQKLVPGDIVLLKAGDKVPADARIIQSLGLKINEAILTGEWISAEKTAAVLPKDTALADRDNMVYMGTIVEAGEGRAIVTAIGMDTELGRIAGLIKETREEKTPYQKKLSHFSKIVGLFIGLASLLIFIIGFAKNGHFLEMFTTAVAVAVSAIPEGLPVALTVILAIGMQNILKKKGLVRKLSSAETLGNTSIIATDKTLTLTQGRMKAAEILSKSKKLALKIAVLCNEAFIENYRQLRPLWAIRGRSTDKALILAGLRKGLVKNELEKKFPKIDEVPFDSQNKFIVSLCRTSSPKTNLLLMSGAPENVLARCSFYKKKKGAEKIGEKDRQRIEKELKSLTNKGQRVIAVAYQKTNQERIEIKKIKDLVFVGFLGLKDPLRPDAKRAIALAKKAGMKPIIVTGDHILTAKAVAKKLGLKTGRGNVVEGRELDEMSDSRLEKRLNKISVFARVEPKHKLRIISAWQRKNQVVAMTGDGINDAPALKKADIGIALGSGTDIAKEVSDLVLLNDSFSIILTAVEEGRAILDNIRKVITYLLSDSFTELILIGASIVLGYPLPVTAVQILWVNLIEDGITSIALAFEPKEKDLMKIKPQTKTNLLTKEMKTIIFIIGIFTDLILLFLFFWLLARFGRINLAYVRTMIFVALSIDSLFYIFSCKSLRRNLWQTKIFSNKLLNISWLTGAAFLLMAVYLPIFQTLLGTVALTGFDWLILVFFGLINVVSIETAKHWFIVRRQTNV